MTTDLVRGWAASLAIIGTLLWPTACHSPAQESSIYIDVNRVPAGMRADYRAFAVNCSKCHSLARALNAPVVEPHHWDLYVARMMRTAGSAISPDEAPHILSFLHWYTASYDRTGGLPGSTSQPAAASPAEAPEQATPSDPSAPREPASAPAPAAQPTSPEGAPPPATETPANDVTTAAEGEQ